MIKLNDKEIEILKFLNENKMGSSNMNLTSHFFQHNQNDLNHFEHLEDLELIHFINGSSNLANLLEDHPRYPSGTFWGRISTKGEEWLVKVKANI